MSSRQVEGHRETRVCGAETFNDSHCRPLHLSLIAWAISLAPLMVASFGRRSRVVIVMYSWRASGEENFMKPALRPSWISPVR